MAPFTPVLFLVNVPALEWNSAKVLISYYGAVVVVVVVLVVVLDVVGDVSGSCRIFLNTASLITPPWKATVAAMIS